MMRRLAAGIFLSLAALATGLPAAAQTVETGQGPVQILPLGARNGVFVLDGGTGTLYAGPRLVAIEPDGTVRFPGDSVAFDPATSVDPRVFALDARGALVWAGLGFSDAQVDAEEPPPTAAGFAVSADGGQTFRYRFPSLDEFADTTVTYGVSTLRKAPTTAPQNAAPVDIAIAAGDTVYAATGFGGLRRTVDGGATWASIVLPPDSLVVLDPRETYDFPFEPGQQTRPDGTVPEFALNFVPYSVLSDEAGTLWVGTAYGLNRSFRVPGQSDPGWVRYLDSPVAGSDGGPSGPVGNLIYALEARPRVDGRDDVWAACFVSGIPGVAQDEEPGVVVWRGDDADGFARFETVLLGVTVFDLAFDDARAYAAAGSDGLYISDDDGASWRVVRTFVAADGRALPLNPSAGVFAVATAATGLYAGTSDGLLRSTDGGQTWTLARASPEPGADTSGDDTPEPDVDVYAYPNPFTPRTDGALRIRFTLDAPSDATVRVFDTAMNLVRTVEAGGRPAGANEVAWDGLTDDGLRVANGPYIYVVRAGGRQLSGRVLVFE